MNILQKKDNEMQILEVSGILTVTNSLKLKKAVNKNLGKGKHLEVRVDDVSEVDLSFFQLLAAAVKTAEAIEGGFSVKIPTQGPVMENLKLTGLLNHKSCLKPDCIWCSIAEQVQGE